MKKLIFLFCLLLSATNFAFYKDHVPAHIQLLDKGSLAFQKRLDLIKKAKKTIEVEYFIYSIDEVGRLFTQALVEKANQGVKVRILIDKSAPVFELNKYFAKELQKEGKNGGKIEIRYYNAASIFLFRSSQFRNHRKLLIVDDEETITGGRNIANEYFDFDKEYNFADRDVYIRSKELVTAIRESFDAFWKHKIVKKPKKVEQPKWEDYECEAFEEGCDDMMERIDFERDLRKYNKKISEARHYMTVKESDLELRQKLEEKARVELEDNKEFLCENSGFYSDKPGKGKKSQVLKDHLAKIINKTQREIFTESPYFILYRKTGKELATLLENDVKVSVLTNSLASSDAIYVATVFNTIAPYWIQKGLDAYIYNGKAPTDLTSPVEEAQTATWGVHSKTAVFDESIALIGTYNIDPRSRNLNAELTYSCEGNEDFAKLVKKSIVKRMNDGAVKLNEKGKPVDGRRLLFDVKGGKKALYYALWLPSMIFKMLL